MVPITVSAPAARVLSMNQPGSGARLRASSFTTTATVTTVMSAAAANQLSTGRAPAD